MGANGFLDRESVDAVLNDLDEYAVEEALRIVEANGGNEEGGPHTVTVISMGPTRATDAIRKALSMGANDAILVSDAALAGSDALAIHPLKELWLRRKKQLKLVTLQQLEHLHKAHGHKLLIQRFVHHGLRE